MTDVSQPSGSLTYACYFEGWNADTLESVFFDEMPVAGTYKPGEFSDEVLEHFLAGEYAGFVYSTNPRDLIGSDTGLDQITLPQELSVEYQAPANFKTFRDSRTQSLVVRAGGQAPNVRHVCRLPLSRLRLSNPEQYGDTMAEVADKLHSSGRRISFTDYGDYVIEFRGYRACDANATIQVGFFDGHAYAKSYHV